MTHIEALRSQLARLGCDGTRTRVTVEPIDDSPGFARVFCPGDGEDPLEVAPEALARLLAALPDDAPLDLGEDGSVWEVIDSLANSGFLATVRYVESLGLAVL